MASGRAKTHLHAQRRKPHLLPGFNQIKPAAELGQRQPAIFDARPSVIIYIVERAAHSRPVNAAIARMDELATVAIRVELEIFDVQFRDEAVERFDPILRWRLLHMIANIEVGLYPGAVKRRDKLPEKSRFHPKIVPHVFQGDDDLQLLGKRNELLNRLA